MTPAEWTTLAQTVGVPAAMLVSIGLWVGKWLVPTMIKSFEDRIDSTYAEHARDREAFGNAIRDITEAIKTRPCWYSSPQSSPQNIAREARQAGGGE